MKYVSATKIVLAKLSTLQNIIFIHQELNESRRLLDDTSKEKALLKLENNKLNGILDDLRPKLLQEQSANKQLQDKLRNVERTLNEKVSLLSVYTSEKLQMQVC